MREESALRDPQDCQGLADIGTLQGHKLWPRNLAFPKKDLFLMINGMEAGNSTYWNIKGGIQFVMSITRCNSRK